MDEQDYIDAIWEIMPPPMHEAVPMSILKLSEEAVRDFPLSSELWMLRAMLLQYVPSNYDEGELDEETCFKRASELDPTSVEIWTEYGFYYDIYKNDQNTAIEHFQRAIDFGGSAYTYFGMARALAQLGRSEEAIDLIDRTLATTFEPEDVIRLEELRDEILQGIWAPDPPP